MLITIASKNSDNIRKNRTTLTGNRNAKKNNCKGISSDK